MFTIDMLRALKSSLSIVASMFCDPYNYIETRLKTCLYIVITMLVQQLYFKDLTGLLLEVITGKRRPIYTNLYVHILMIKIMVLFSLYALIYGHKCEKQMYHVYMWRDLNVRKQQTLTCGRYYCMQTRFL